MIPEPWLSFLRDVDSALSRHVEVHCLGGFVLSVLWELPRPTGDVDFIEIKPSGAASELNDIAGADSRLAGSHKLRFHQATFTSKSEHYQNRIRNSFSALVSGESR